MRGSDADGKSAYVVHDKVRDKMYLDMRQTFSIWFIPMYHAHVRLVTVLDLVDSDSPDYHDPLDRMLKNEGRGKEGVTNGASQHHRNGSRNNNDNNDNHRRHQHNGSRSSNHHKHSSCTWKISKQEDLYQVTDFLKFAGGPGPFPFLWYLFQLGASAVCVFLSLLLLATPWAFQKEPARGGVEAAIECVESPTTTSSFCDQEIARDDNDAASTSDSRSKALGGGGSVSGEDYSQAGHNGESGGPVGGDGDGGSHNNNNNNGNDSNDNNSNHNASTNGHRRNSSNSKASSSSIPKKSRKNGTHSKKKAAAT